MSLFVFVAIRSDKYLTKVQTVVKQENTQQGSWATPAQDLRCFPIQVVPGATRCHQVPPGARPLEIRRFLGWCQFSGDWEVANMGLHNTWWVIFLSSHTIFKHPLQPLGKASLCLTDTYLDISNSDLGSTRSMRCVSHIEELLCWTFILTEHEHSSNLTASYNPRCILDLSQGQRIPIAVDGFKSQHSVPLTCAW